MGASPSSFDLDFRPDQSSVDMKSVLNKLFGPVPTVGDACVHGITINGHKVETLVWLFNQLPREHESRNFRILIKFNRLTAFTAKKVNSLHPHPNAIIPKCKNINTCGSSTPLTPELVAELAIIALETGVSAIRR